MPKTSVNGVEIFYRDEGDGRPLVLVHGSWVDHRSWEPVIEPLAQHFRVVAYDRRGHSQSERPAGQGSVREDVADLAALIKGLGLAPANVVANSFGASISLRLATESPDLFASLSVHEPPLMGVIAGDPNLAAVVADTMGAIGGVISRLNAGDLEGGARDFVAAVLGPDAWEAQLTVEDRKTFIDNAPTFLDESRDPAGLSLDLALLADFSRPTLLTVGSESPPFFPPVISRLAEAFPNALLHTFEGAGHLPHQTHAEAYVQAIASFVEQAA